jgi:hypothetical protein
VYLLPEFFIDTVGDSGRFGHLLFVCLFFSHPRWKCKKLQRRKHVGDFFIPGHSVLMEVEAPSLSLLFQNLSQACEKENEDDRYETATCFWTVFEEEAKTRDGEEAEQYSSAFLKSFSEYLLGTSSASNMLLDYYGLEVAQLLIPHLDHHKEEVHQVNIPMPSLTLNQIFQELRKRLSTRELLLSCQSAFWLAQSDLQKIGLVHFLGSLVKDLPVEKRIPFVAQLTSTLGTLITPIDMTDEEEMEETHGKDKKKITGDKLDMKVSNNSPEAIEEREETIRIARDKLLVVFLPAILDFYETVLTGMPGLLLRFSFFPSPLPFPG